MSSTRRLGVVLLSVVFVLPGVSAAPQDSLSYSVDTGSDIVTFVARPELGHVVKRSMRGSATRLTSAGPQGIEDEDKEYLNVSGRPEVQVVLGRQPLIEHDRNIRLLAVQSDTEYVAPLFSLGGQTVAVIPEIIVRLDHETDIDRLEELCWEVDCTIMRNLLYTQQEFLISTAVRNAEDVLAIVEVLSSVDFVEWAWPNIAFQPKLCNQPPADDAEIIGPNDPYFSKQWHLKAIHAPEAWAYLKALGLPPGDPNIVVAVLDSGVDVNHADLANNIWVNPIEAADDGVVGVDDDGNGHIDDVHGWDFVDDDKTVDPVGDKWNAHGTACAGLIAAQGNNNIGVTGVASNCTIMPVRIVRILHVGENDLSTWGDPAEALRYAAVQGADVISNSWGGGPDSEPIHSAIRDITRLGGIGRNGKGCVVFFASGNEGEVVYPAKYPEVIAVGAVDQNDEIWDYSGRGTELDIVAPSGKPNWTGDLWTTDITGDDGANNGDLSISNYTDKMGATSGACPIAAGVAALMLSIDPNLATIDVERILLHSAWDLGDPGWDEEYGFGCVDAYTAVTAVLDPQEPPFSTYFVDANADPDFEDGSEEHPFDSIQEAIDQCIHRDIVIVRDGTYIGEGNRDIDFGGKIIIVRSEKGPEDCIIDCEGEGRGFHFHNGEGANSVLEGFTIKDGYADKGGGIYNDGSSPTIISCIFTGNSADTDGGGLYNNSSSPDVIDCTFTENSAEDGGGVYNNDSSPTVANCRFTGNEANRGGGMRNYKGSPTVTNCRFTGNEAYHRGGGMYNFGRKPTVANCTFAENSATEEGGGVYNNASTMTMINCTVIRNSATNGGGMYKEDIGSLSSLTVINCILWENAPNQIVTKIGNAIISYSNIQNGWLYGEGNLAVDPNFADIDNGDYHLQSQAERWDPSSRSWVQDKDTSPCIDTGDPDTPVGDEPLPNGGRINMGAYGGTAQASKSPE